ncbi:MAG: methionyl-tRNA formyltransferase, partial [Patescibacteria group bacterium]
MSDRIKGDMKKTKVIFLGTPDFAASTLRVLHENPGIDVELVIMQPDKPVGRKGEMTPPPIKSLAEKYGLTVMQPDSINQDDIIDMVRRAEPDFIVVVAYGQILGSEWLNLAEKEILNVHASLLPRWRGASPIQSSVLAGDDVTGVSIMGVRKKMDTGPVYLQKEVSIENKNSYELFDELSEMGADALLEVVLGFEKFSPMKQDNGQATYCKKITRKSGEVSLDD